MASPADTIMRILAARMGQGGATVLANQHAMDRLFRPLNAGIARGQGMAHQASMQSSAQQFQGAQNAQERLVREGEGEKNREAARGLQKALLGHRSEEAGKAREFAAGESALGRELTQEGIDKTYRMNMANLGARMREGNFDRVQSLKMQKDLFDQQDKMFKQQTRVAFARDVRAAMEAAKGDQRKAKAGIEAITTRYGEEMKLQTAASAMRAFATHVRGGGKPDWGLATPNAYITSGLNLLRGDQYGFPYPFMTPEWKGDILFTMRKAWGAAAKEFKRMDMKDKGGYFKMVDDAFSVLGALED